MNTHTQPEDFRAGLCQIERIKDELTKGFTTHKQAHTHAWRADDAEVERLDWIFNHCLRCWLGAVIKAANLLFKVLIK